MSKYKVGDLVDVIDRENPVQTYWGTKSQIKGAEVVHLYPNGDIEVKFDGLPQTVSQTQVVPHVKESEMKKVAMTMTEKSLSVFLDGKMHNITNKDASYGPLKALVKEDKHTEGNVRDLLDKATLVEAQTEGLVKVKDGTVYFDGEPVYDTLAQKLLYLINQGVSAKPWMKFMENVMDNPSYKSRKALYDFLDHFETPITEDGHFLAFKRVRGNYMDIHSGTFDNSPGNIVEMPRANVDDDSNRTCSAGLHACASNYLGSFYATSSNAKVVVVKINPRDVVAVPGDYSFSKMRVCRYEVLGDAQEATVDNLSKGHYTKWDTEGDDYYSDYDEDILEDEDYGFDNDFDWRF